MYNSKWNWRYEVEQNRKIIDYNEQINLVFNPYRDAFNYNVEIDYSSQQIVDIGLLLLL